MPPDTHTHTHTRLSDIFTAIASSAEEKRSLQERSWPQNKTRNPKQNKNTHKKRKANSEIRIHDRLTHATFLSLSFSLSLSLSLFLIPPPHLDPLDLFPHPDCVCECDCAGRPPPLPVFLAEGGTVSNQPLLSRACGHHSTPRNHSHTHTQTCRGVQRPTHAVVILHSPTCMIEHSSHTRLHTCRTSPPPPDTPSRRMPHTLFPRDPGGTLPFVNGVCVCVLFG